jgi:hypothetical protein
MGEAVPRRSMHSFGVYYSGQQCAFPGRTMFYQCSPPGEKCMQGKSLDLSHGDINTSCLYRIINQRVFMEKDNFHHQDWLVSLSIHAGVIASNEYIGHPGY